MRKDQIQLRLDGAHGQIEVDALLRGAGALLELIRRPGSDARWVVADLRLGSLLLAVRPSRPLTHDDVATIDQVQETLTSLTRPTTLPPTWEPQRVQALLELARLSSTSHVRAVSLTIGDSEHLIDEQVGRNIEESIDVALPGRPSLGSVRGVLKRYHGVRREVGIKDPMTGKMIKATFPASITRQVAAAVEHNVVAWGELVRDERGAKVQLRMHDLEDLGVDAPAPPPPVEEMIGLYGPDWTGGLSSDEWIRRGRE